jgi:AI-2 transport protein TqsA
VVLKIFGTDFAELLGLLAFVLNFIPVIGSVIAVVVPVVLSLMQFDTVLPALQIALLLAGVQFLIGNVVEPKMMGRTLNLSPFVIIVSLTFWTTIWGMVGAFLSVPITASAVILCRNIQPMRWLAILLSADGIPEASDEPAEPKLKISWPFNKTAAESEQFKELKAELEAMKAEKAKVAKPRAAEAKKPAKRRAPISKTRKTQK